MSGFRILGPKPDLTGVTPSDVKLTMFEALELIAGYLHQTADGVDLTRFGHALPLLAAAYRRAALTQLPRGDRA